MYNGGSELNANNQWYETHFRGYDPAIGRMLQVDPYASSFSSLTPYNFANNDPVYFNDPSGGYMRPPFEWFPKYIHTWHLQLYGFDPRIGGGGGSGLMMGAPGSGNHWTDYVRDPIGNFHLMSFATFASIYNVDFRADDWRHQVAMAVSIPVVRIGEPVNGAFWQSVRAGGHVTVTLNIDELISNLGNKIQAQEVLNAEAFIDGLLEMNVGDKISGKELSKIFESKGVETPIDVKNVLKNLKRVKEGFQVNLTLLANVALALLPKTPEIKDGSIITITREDWRDNKNSVLHLVSPDIKIYYGDSLVPLNIYINNNGFTMDKVAYPTYYPIQKGKW